MTKTYFNIIITLLFCLILFNSFSVYNYLTTEHNVGELHYHLEEFIKLDYCADKASDLQAAESIKEVIETELLFEENEREKIILETKLANNIKIITESRSALLHRECWEAKSF